MKRIAVFILLCGTIFSAQSQVVISPMPHPQGFFGLEDIWRINLISTQPQAISVQLEVNVEDAQHGLILTATSPIFNLLQGNNRLAFQPSGTRLQYGKGNKTQVLRGTGRFPYGSYVICYRLLSANNGNVLAEFCQEELIRPFSPPELIAPYNGEDIHTTLPILVWKPPLPPGTIPVEYNLRLVEIKPRQHLVEALEKNAPLINRSGLFSTSLPYPGEAPKLEAGKSYAWQVSARAGDFELGVTEVWEFRISEEQSKMELSPGDTLFRELRLAPIGSYNPITQKLRFAFDNRWGAPKMRYETSSPPDTLEYVYYKIYPAGEQGSPLTPTISTNLVTGMNQITINLSGVMGINDGERYILELRDPTGRFYYLEFTYNS